MIVPQFSITGLQHKHFSDGVDIDVTYTRNGTHITHINSVRFAYNFSTLEQDYNCEYVTFLNNEGSVVVGGKRFELVPRVGQIITELENTLIDDEINERRAADEQNTLRIPLIPPTPPAPSDRSPLLTASSSLVNTTNPDGTIEVIRSDGQQLPPIPINQLANDAHTPADLITHCDAISFDGTYIWAGLSTDPAKILKINPVDNSYTVITEAAGEDFTSANITIHDDNGNIITAADFNTAPVTTFQISPEISTEKPAPKRQRTRWELLELD